MGCVRDAAALYIEPSRLAVCFDGMVDSDCARGSSLARLEERLSVSSVRATGWPHTIAAEDVSDTDRSIALASSDSWRSLRAARRDLLGEQHCQYRSGRGCGGVRCRAG